MPEAKRILVLAESATEAARHRDVAEKLALELMLACSDESGQLRLDFDSRDSALRIVELAHQQPFVAVIPVRDRAAPVAARACSMLGLPFHTPKAADACKDKVLLRRKLGALELAGELQRAGGDDLLYLTCLMSDSRLRVLAAVRGDQQRGPLSGLDNAQRERVGSALRSVVPALGLKHGPVHVTLVRGANILVQDVSLASGTSETMGLRFRIPLVEQYMSFEEVVIRNALGLDVSRIYLDQTNVSTV